LIGVSFTSVVGYRGVASDVKASPLFNIRISRAIDEESEVLTCEYVGRGDDFYLLIPERDRKISLIQNFINKISKMDDTTFNRLMKRVLTYRNMENLETNKIPQLIRERPEEIKKYNRVLSPSIDYECTSNNWFPGCVLHKLVDYIINVFVAISIGIIMIYTIISDCLETFGCAP
jgi:hypothetical protein